MYSHSKQFILQVFSDFGEDECPSMAAALAYGTLFSLPSLLLIIIFVAGLILGPKAASGQIQAKLSAQIGAQAAGEIQTMVDNVARNRSGGLIATGFGVIGLVLSAMSVVMQLEQCLNRAWKVTVTATGIRNFALKRMRSALMLVGAGLLALISLAAGSVLAALSRMIPFASAAEYGELASSLVMFALVFGAILKMLPDVKIGWRDAATGGMFIALLFIFGKFLIGLYLEHAGKASIYGAAGSLAMILLWTYYSALIFLLGVEFTQVWVRFHGRAVEAKPGATLIARPALNTTGAGGN